MVQHLAVVVRVQHVRLPERRENLLLALPPLRQQLLVLLWGLKNAQPVHRLDVVVRPETEQRREVMRADHGERLIVVILRHPVIAVVVVEIHHAVRIDGVLTQRAAHLLRHNAQILTDHHTAFTVALQRQNRHQVGNRITHIGAKIGAVAISNPPKATKRHHMINAQNAIDAHIGAQHLDKHTITAALQPLRMQRRQIPVLPGRAQLVRRRANRHLQTVHLAVNPCIRAAARHADRQITIQPQRHSRLMTGHTHQIQLLRHHPLQPHIKTDIRLVRHRKRLHRRTVRVAVRLRPAKPADRILTERNRRGLRIKIMIKRLKRRKQPQLPPAPADKLLKRPARGDKRLLRLKIVENQAQRAHLQRHHLRIIHPVGLAQPRKHRLRLRIRKPRLRRRRRLKQLHPADININRVQPAPRRRTIRTGPVRPRRKQRVQRIDAEKINPVLAKIHRQAAQIAQIANAPVKRRTQTVHLHIHPA